MIQRPPEDHAGEAEARGAKGGGSIQPVGGCGVEGEDGRGVVDAVFGGEERVDGGGEGGGGNEVELGGGC